MPRIAVIGNYPAIVTGFTLPLPIHVGVGGRPPHTGVPVVSLDPIQVAGLIPLFPCDTEECRAICDDGWKNPVFGEILPNGNYQNVPTYENDFSPFKIDIPLFNANPTAVSVTFILEKLFEGQWRPYPFGLNLNTNGFGNLYQLNSIAGHGSYAGYDINWGAVLFYAGMGCYRFKAKTSFTTYQTSNQVAGAIQSTTTFNLAGVTCAAGAITGTLKTTSGNIPATYTINQPNTSFTIAQNVQYIVNLINAGSYPYTAVRTGDTFTISGQSYAANNNITWQLGVFKAGMCDYVKTERMTGGKDGEPILIPIVVEGCLESPPFDLKKWDCFRAHGTVKWETWMTGIIGDPYEDYKQHNLCNILAYDSLRTYGFFGYQKTPEYKTENQEWGTPHHGKIEHIRDEQFQRWEYLSKYLPEYIHTRFSTFAMMSDKTFISDYTLNNSDWTIKRKNVIKDSDYSPEYIDKDAYWQRRNKAKVQAFFKRGVQSVIKSLCCPTN